MRENSEMKQKILLTACERFNENGYENTSLDMICLTAGISKRYHLLLFSQQR